MAACSTVAQHHGQYLSDYFTKEAVMQTWSGEMYGYALVAISLANLSLEPINVRGPDKLLPGGMASEMANQGVTIHLSTPGLHHHLLGEIIRDILAGMLRHHRTGGHDM